MTDWKVRSASEELGLEDRTATQLRALIESGSIPPGEQLSSEPELAKILGVSRPTLRVAISILVADRLLVRKRGVGTFVAAASSLSNGYERLRGTTETISLNGQEPGVRHLDVQHGFAPLRVAEELGVEEGAPVLKLMRTFTADRVPVMFAEEWIPLDLLAPESVFDDFGDQDSLYQRLTEIGLPIRRVVARFVPTNATGLVAASLEAEIGEPLLLLEQLHYADSVPDRVVMFSDNYHHTGRIDVQIVRRG
jgi:GntR family transcriptional regulator